jgi:hypothetical protein
VIHDDFVDCIVFLIFATHWASFIVGSVD